MSHRHSFNGPLAGILLKVAVKFSVGQPFHLQRDLDLCKSEYCNFQKLRYWGLVDKYCESGRRKGGYWCLDPYVEVVLYNEVTLAKWVETFNNEVIQRSAKKILFKDAMGEFEIPELWARKSRPMRFSDEKQMAFV